MKNVNIADLKNNLSSYLREVKAGAEILVRERDTPIAKLVPLVRDPPSDAELARLESQGKIRIGQGAIDEAFWELPAPRVPHEALVKAMELERDETEAS